MPAAPPLIIGSFEIDKEIGRGGMGVVYGGRHSLLRHPVAVKVLNDDLAATPGYIDRFLLEARTAAKITHPAVVRVFDAGRHEGRYFIAMELIEGTNLADQVKDHGPISCARARELLKQTAAGLAEAHRFGLLHRDVKPENLMLTREGKVKVSDFGLAKDLVAETKLTQTGIVLGTPAYMSPEQCEGRKLTTASDIYSLGASFYHCVTGRIPYEADSVARMLMKHIQDPVPYAAEANDEVDFDFANLLTRMMAKLPDERFADASDLVRFLESGAASTPASRAVRARRKGLKIAIGTATLLLGCALAWSWISWPAKAPAAVAQKDPGTAPPPAEERTTDSPPAPRTLPADAAGSANEAAACLARGDLAGAEELFRHALTFGEDAAIRARLEPLAAHRDCLARADRSIALDRWEEAEAALGEAMGKLGVEATEARLARMKDFRAHLAAGEAHLAGQRYAEAEDAFAAARKIFDTPMVRVRLETARAGRSQTETGNEPPGALGR